MKSAKITIKSIRKGDQHLLRSFIYKAIFIPPGAEPLPFNMVDSFVLQPYHKQWGKPGDAGFIAWDDNAIPTGAAWVRYIRGYGYINDWTPELTIAVQAEYRNLGIGTQLLSRLIDRLSAEGVPSISLSVDADNKACELYRRMGFEEISFKDGTYIMIKYLS